MLYLQIINIGTEIFCALSPNHQHRDGNIRRIKSSLKVNEENKLMMIFFVIYYTDEEYEMSACH